MNRSKANANKQSATALYKPVHRMQPNNLQARAACFAESLSVKIPFIHKVGGLARVLRIGTEGGGVESFPVVRELYTAGLLGNVEGETPMIPDSAQPGICFVESVGEPTQRELSGGRQGFDHPCRLVVWVNKSLLVGDTIDQMQMVFLRAVRSLSDFNTGALIVNVPSLWAAYSLPEEQSQFLTHPYASFGVSFTLSTFTASAGHFSQCDPLGAVANLSKLC